MNDAIGYARDGIQLQKLSEFITKDLGKQENTYYGIALLKYWLFSP